MFKKVNRKEIRRKKHMKVRKKISGTVERPRLAMYRSLNNVYVQIIDDVAGNTLLTASSLDAEIKAQLDGKSGNKEAAKLVGKAIAEKAVAKGFETVVFDRGGLMYHGRVAALADGAREGGLKF